MVPTTPLGRWWAGDRILVRPQSWRLTPVCRWAKCPASEERLELTRSRSKATPIRYVKSR
jgi:hypothetical protein